MLAISLLSSIVFILLQSSLFNESSSSPTSSSSSSQISSSSLPFNSGQLSTFFTTNNNNNNDIESNGKVEINKNSNVNTPYDEGKKRKISSSKFNFTTKRKSKLNDVHSGESTQRRHSCKWPSLAECFYGETV